MYKLHSPQLYYSTSVVDGTNSFTSEVDFPQVAVRRTPTAASLAADEFSPTEDIVACQSAAGGSLSAPPINSPVVKSRRTSRGQRIQGRHVGMNALPEHYSFSLPVSCSLLLGCRARSTCSKRRCHPVTFRQIPRISSPLTAREGSNDPSLRRHSTTVILYCCTRSASRGGG